MRVRLGFEPGLVLAAAVIAAAAPAVAASALAAPAQSASRASARRGGASAPAKPVSRTADSTAAFGGASSLRAPQSARVSYLAGASVYLDAGRLDGVLESDTLAVLRGNAVHAWLVVRYLSSHRAVCDTLGAIGMPAIGDAVALVVRPLPAPLGADSSGAGGAATDGAGVGAPADSTAATASGAAITDSAAVVDDGVAAPEGPATPPRPRRRLRGRVGGHLLTVRGEHSTGFSQPSFDTRLNGTNLAAGRLDVAVDARGRRTIRLAGRGERGVARVYRLNAALHDIRNRNRLVAGRQLAEELASVSVFDGLVAEHAGTRVRFGGFAGTEPDPDLRPATRIVDGGAYAAWRSRAGTIDHWSLASGYVASFDQGRFNRQYLFLNGRYGDPRFMLSGLQEVDINGSWKRALGEPVLDPTSTFLTVRAQATRRVVLQAGYDSRRNVRLYRDFITPETEFDDRFQRGGWAGTAVSLPRGFRLGGDGRWRTGGSAGAFHSWSATADAMRLPWSELRGRWTHFDDARSDGDLLSWTFAVRPLAASRLEVNGGERTSRDDVTRARSTQRWQGAYLDLGLPGSVYLVFSIEHDRSELDDDVQSYSSVSWSFR